MCDYSLEMYRSRPAVAHERYETRRFASGSIGFTAPGDPDTAICMACDTRIALCNISPETQQHLGVDAEATVTFVRLESGPHHDGVRFDNGIEVTLQQIGPGISAFVAEPLTSPPEIGRAEPATKDLEPAI